MMSFKKDLEATVCKVEELPTQSELQLMLEKNELVKLAHRLRDQHPFNYRELLQTAKGLKTLDQKILQQSVHFFTSNDPDGLDDDSANSEYNKNLVDNVIYNAGMIIPTDGAYDKFNIKKRWWTPEEDEQLKQLVDQFGARNWKRIASYFVDRTDVQCLHRWQKVLNPKLIKGPWTKEQDELVMSLVLRHGAKNWTYIAKHLPGRIGKQCRERWHNHLNPDIKKERWTDQEDRAIIQAHKKLGNRWALIAKWLPGRTDNAIKNHWNSTIKRKLRMHNIDDEGEQNISVAQKLSFSTPQKDRTRHWKLSTTAQNLTRNLFDSYKKSEFFSSEITRIVMPLVPQQLESSKDIIARIQVLLFDEE